MMVSLRGGFLEDRPTNPLIDHESDEEMDNIGFSSPDEVSDEHMSEDDKVSNDESEDEDDEFGHEEDEDENYDENEEWPWIEGYKTNEKRIIDGKEENVAYCSGRLIHPDMIRADFCEEMEEPSQGLADLAYTLFDRWGRLKEDFQEHIIKRGSGAWGQELHEDTNFLVYETIFVDKRFRRQGIARRMMEKLWTKVTASDPKCKYAFAWAVELPNRDISDEREKMEVVERAKHADKGQAIIQRFLRTSGFRRVGTSDWFCLAKDPAHPSRSLSIEQDYNLPEHQIAAEAVEFQKTLAELDDDACKAYLFARTQERDPDLDSIWAMLGYENNTVLHTVFKPNQRNHTVIKQQGSYYGPVPANRTTKTNTLMWLLSQPFIRPLLSVINQRGETPEEAYQSYLEKKRVYTTAGMMKIHLSDKFHGHTQDEVKCLFQFQGRTNATGQEFVCAMFGCSCGLCVGGFLSPRMMFALECAADMIGDTLGFEFESETEDVAFYIEMNADGSLKYLEPSVRQNLCTNKSMRRGLCALFHHVATCCRQGEVPITSEILSLLEDESEWPPNTKNFFQRGGKVSSAVRAAFDHVKMEHKYLGSGDHEEAFSTEIADLEPCRNDLEVECAHNFYVAMEQVEE